MEIFNEKCLDELVTDVSALNCLRDIKDCEEVKHKLEKFGLKATDEDVDCILKSISLIKNPRGDDDSEVLGDDDLQNVSGGGIGLIVLGVVVVLLGTAAVGGSGYGIYKIVKKALKK